MTCRNRIVVLRIRERTDAPVPEGLCIRSIGSSGARGDIRDWLSNLEIIDE